MSFAIILISVQNYAKKKEAGDKDKKAQDTGERKPKSGYRNPTLQVQIMNRSMNSNPLKRNRTHSVAQSPVLLQGLLTRNTRTFPDPKPRKRPAPRPAPRPAHSGTPLYKKRKTEPKPPPKTFYSTFAQLEQAASDLEFTYLLQSAVNSFPHPIPERRKSWKEDLILVLQYLLSGMVDSRFKLLKLLTSRFSRKSLGLMSMLVSNSGQADPSHQAGRMSRPSTFNVALQARFSKHSRMICVD
ncbi:hypothetical protein R3P38DRAFT_3449764 [Favolaschia claudopus]|uniref:Uncharacterized protein n=1 Tax=Favolaschia claudopus TaxID=2862362 RepID=A0AAV9ZMI9_9AGAR